MNKTNRRQNVHGGVTKKKMSKRCKAKKNLKFWRKRALERARLIDLIEVSPSDVFSLRDEKIRLENQLEVARRQTRRARVSKIIFIVTVRNKTLTRKL